MYQHLFYILTEWFFPEKVFNLQKQDASKLKSFDKKRLS